MLLLKVRDFCSGYFLMTIGGGHMKVLSFCIAIVVFGLVKGHTADENGHPYLDELEEVNERIKVRILEKMKDDIENEYHSPIELSLRELASAANRELASVAKHEYVKNSGGEKEKSFRDLADMAKEEDDFDHRFIRIQTILQSMWQKMQDNRDAGASDDDAVADTNCGMVRGIWSQEDGAFSFRGIPYASPPVGNLRWRPPLAIRKENNNCWSGTLTAQQFGSQCVQRDWKHASGILGSEDCLYLNVLTPTLDVSAKLPVMFWIHGGYLLRGNGNQYDIGYAPTPALAKQLNVVFVSINYRLQALGFMALEWLKAGSPTNTSGNYGFMDMIEALRWVQENIHNFGGDPNQVTVFGQSSGGTAIVALLASPLCKGLFHKAWMLSASPVMNKTATEAFKDNEMFIRNTGCGNVSCLYNLSASAVTKSVPWHVFPYWSMDDLLGLPNKGRFDGALAIVDLYVLHEAPFEVWSHGNGVDVPVMIGTTAQETDVGAADLGYINWSWSTSDYRDHVIQKMDPFGDLIAQTALNMYPENISTPEFQITSMVTDIRVTCGNDYLAKVLAASFKSPVYRYIATFYDIHQPATPFGDDQIKYAFHAIDIFGFFHAMALVLDTRSGILSRKWEANIQREVMAFVNTGKPATPNWLGYPDVTAELNTDTETCRGYHTVQCEFWLQNGFFSYSWIN